MTAHSTHHDVASDALQHIGDLVYVVRLRPTVAVEYLSPSISEMLGYGFDGAEVGWASLLDRVDPRHRDRVANQARFVSQGEQELELRLVTRDGEPRWTSHRYRVIERSDGSIAMFGTARDIDQQHHDRERLHRLEEQYHLLAEYATDIVYFAGPDRLVRWVSPSLTEAFGWEPEDLIGRSVAEFIHPVDREESEGSRTRLYAPEPSGFSIRQYLMRVRTKDGQYRWVSGRATPVFADDGSMLGVVNGMRDVDDLVASREAARAERATLRAVIDSMLDPHALIRLIRDGDGRPVDVAFVDVNPVGCAWLGRTHEELEGTRLSDLNPEFGREEVIAAVAEAIESGTAVVVDDIPLEVLPGHGQRYLDIRGVPIDDTMSVTIHDSTERHATAAALAESNRLYSVLAEHASDVVSLVRSDGIVEWISPSIRSVMGWAPAEIVGTAVTDLVHPDDMEQVQERHALLRQGLPQHFECRMRAASGHYRWFSFTSRPVFDASGAVSGRVSGWHDINNEMEARLRLAESEQRNRLAMTNAPTGMALLDSSHHLVQVNRALTQMVRLTEDELLGRALRTLFDPADAHVVDDVLRDTALAGVGEGELRLFTGGHAAVWVAFSLAAFDHDQGPARIVAQFVDITAARQARDQLRHQATHDTLTGLGNRRDLLSKAAALAGHVTRDAMLGVLFIDVDHLKQINDQHGHAAGDELLVQTAQRISEHVRASDVVARFGGDEFVVLLPNLRSAGDAARIADQVLMACSEPIEHHGHRLQPTVSIGVAITDRSTRPADVLQRADDAMYIAKEAGRNRVALNE